MKEQFVTPEELDYQRECARRVAETGHAGTAFVDTYGCQQNEADSERMCGMLQEMGYTLVSSEDADLIIINSCAVREHAEQRVFGNIGRLTHTKEKNPDQIIILAGCMAGEEAVREKIRKSYKIVDALLDTTSFWRLPETVMQIKYGQREQLTTPTSEPDSRIAEELPVLRRDKSKAWVSVMYGCNNFCSYCIVPYVRGRERSRRSDDIINEVRVLVADGCRDITLLGQNVNSYGNDREGELNFAGLLERIGALDGDFFVRFMTSHPKDCSRRLLDVMASSPRIAKQLHLPVQSGSDRLLKLMNRRYNTAEYLKIIEYAREKMPDIVLTSDIIVGFPGETEEDFTATLDLIRQVRYDSLFTFIYSPRKGTPAAELNDPTPRSVKSERFDRLIALQNAISKELHTRYIGKRVRALIECEGKRGDTNLAARTEGWRLINLNGDLSLIGQYAQIDITGATTWSLIGKIAED